MSLVTVSIVITVLYVAFMIAVGAYASRRSTGTMGDYFLAGGQIGWIAFSLTLFATWMSTFAFLGSPGFYYRMGVNWLVPHGFLVVASPFLLWFLGRRLWKLGRSQGHMTPGDFFESQFKSRTVRYLSAVVCLLALVPYCLIQLVGIGKVVDASTGGLVSYQLAVSVASLAILAYSLLGGVRAVIWTDAIQALIFAVILVGGAVSFLIATANFPATVAMAEQIQPGVTTFDASQFGWPLTLLVMWGFGYILTPHMWQRIYMTDSAAHLSRGVIVGTVLAFFVIAIPSLLIGVLARGAGLEVADTDTLMVAVFTNYAHWLLPLLMVGAVSAGMSTVDSQLLTASSIIARDISGQRNPASSAHISRLTVLAGVLLLWAVSLSPARDGAIVLLASKGIAIALLLLVPMLGGLFLKQPRALAASSALIVGGITLLVLESGIMPVSLPFGVGPALAALFMQAFVFIIVQVAVRDRIAVASGG
tara:strand:- start:10036 stop:11466 length:1431 start_codon:yes stop_codon:yes gene_type:complete